MSKRVYTICLIVMWLFIIGLLYQPSLNPAAAITYTDSEFSYSNWDDIVIQDFGGTHDYQYGSDGENGGFMFMRHFIPAPASIQASGIVVAYINTEFRYDPRTQGDIRYLDMEMDGISIESPPSVFGDTYFVIRQNGRIYQSQYPMESFNHPLWTRESVTRMRENDFYHYLGTRDDRPDFSQQGPPIEFGFLRQSTVSTYITSNAVLQEFGMDNFTVRITENYIASDLALTPNGVDTVYVNLAGRGNPNEITIGTNTQGSFLFGKNLGPHPATNVWIDLSFSAPGDYIPQGITFPPSQEYCDPTSFACYWGQWGPSQTTAWAVEANQTYQIPNDWIGYHGSAIFSANIRSDSYDPESSNNRFSQRYEIFNCPTLAGYECPALFLFCDGSFWGPSFDLSIEGTTFGSRSIESFIHAADVAFNILTFYELRDDVMSKRKEGDHFTSLYEAHGAEIVSLLGTHSDLSSEALVVLKTWEPVFRSLTQSSGEVVISQTQIDQLEQFLANLAAAGSPELQTAIAGEIARLGGLDQFANETVGEAADQLLGPYQTFIPAVSN